MRQPRISLVSGLLLALASFSPAPHQETPQPPGTLPGSRPLIQALESDDAAAALAYYRARIPEEAQRLRLLSWLEDLGSEIFATRESAAQHLVEFGPRAGPWLRQRAARKDPEGARRARACLAQLPEVDDLERLRAGLRLALRRPPQETIPVLLGYLPFAEAPPLAEEIQKALSTLAATDAAPLLASVLSDSDILRRAAVAEALAQIPAQRTQAIRALSDLDTHVRWRAAHALLHAGEKAAIPVLIQLLPELSVEERSLVDETLVPLAGDEAPGCPRDDRPGVGKLWQEAWGAWWQRRGPALTLKPLSPALPQQGRRLILWSDLAGTRGEVLEREITGKTLWKIPDMIYPISVQRISPERVLIAEYSYAIPGEELTASRYRGGRVTERLITGGVVWEKEIRGIPVLSARRLADGKTFVVTRNSLLLVAADGTETTVHQRPRRDILAARIGPGGHMALVTHDGLFHWLDARGQETATFPLGGPLVMGVGFDWLPGRRILVPEFGRDRVAEYDATGQLLWQYSVMAPTGVQRLPGGRTLVISTTQKRLVELDRSGAVLNEAMVEFPLLHMEQY